MSTIAMRAGGLPRRFGFGRYAALAVQNWDRTEYAGFAPPAEGAGVAEERSSAESGVSAASPAVPLTAPDAVPVAVASDAGRFSDDAAAIADVAWTPPSWEEIVREHSARIYRLAYRLSGNQQDAALAALDRTSARIVRRAGGWTFTGTGGYENGR